MTALRRVVVWLAVAGALTSTRAEGADTTLHLTVPKEVAAQAARRVAGDATASPPILILEGLELGDNEGVTIRVRGPSEPGSSAQGPILAVTSMVGRAQTAPKAPLQKVTLAVPLNDRASRLLIGRSEVALMLEVTKNPGRPPLKVDRA